MAVSANQGLYYPAPGSAVDVAGDLRRVVESIETRLLLIFASVSDRDTRLRGVTLTEGMLCYLKDSSAYFRWTGSAWDPLVYIGERFKVFERGGPNEFDPINVDTFGTLVQGTWLDAPPGDYALTNTLVMQTHDVTQTTLGALRCFVNSGGPAGNGPEIAFSQGMALSGLLQPYTTSFRYVHGGGDLNVLLQFAPNVRTARIFRNGTHTNVDYLGPRVPAA